MKRKWISAIVVAILIQNTIAISCFVCSSIDNVVCDDPFQGDKNTGEMYLKCAIDTSCQKRKERFNQKIFRACAPDQSCDKLKDELDFCEICQTDGCNGATPFGSISLIILISLAIGQIMIA